MTRIEQILDGFPLFTFKKNPSNICSIRTIRFPIEKRAQYIFQQIVLKMTPQYHVRLRRDFPPFEANFP